MNRIFAIIALTLPLHAFAENIKCDALFLDLETDEPVPGYITGMKMNDQSITLLTNTTKEYAYKIDANASQLKDRTYVGKIGSLPIEQTPMNEQVSVMLVKPEEKENDLDGLLTDTRLDTYVLKNCKSVK